MMSTSTPHRRIRFGLRSLFVLVAVVSMATAWVTYSLNWIRARNEALDHHVMYVTDGKLYPSAPRGLWLFGERGYSNIEPFSIKQPGTFQPTFP